MFLKVVYVSFPVLFLLFLYTKKSINYSINIYFIYIAFKNNDVKLKYLRLLLS